MNAHRIGFLFLFMSGPGLAAGTSPSVLLNQLPAIASPPTLESCEGFDAMLARAEQQAMAEMMHVQELAMSAGIGPVSDKQGELIERLMDPAITMCEMNVALSLPEVDPHGDFQRRAYAAQQATNNEIAAKCPVKGKADYRDSACVDPITKKGLQQERQLLNDYIAAANARLALERDGYAQCAETRERLADEAQAAKLSGQFLSIAVGGRANSWQQFGAVAERYKSYCQEIGRAAADLRMREQAR